MTTAQDGGKVVSLTHRPSLPPGNAPGIHFCWRLSRPQGHSAIGRIMSMKNSNDTIWIFFKSIYLCYLSHCSSDMWVKQKHAFRVDVEVGACQQLWLAVEVLSRWIAWGSTSKYRALVWKRQDFTAPCDMAWWGATKSLEGMLETYLSSIEHLPSGIEPATFRFVAQYLNHCAIISGPQ
jgi:hypothetical protein